LPVSPRGQRKGESRCKRKNWGGKRVIRAEVARRSHVAAGRKRAAVCSMPPSWVGVGIMVSGVSWSSLLAGVVDEEEEDEEDEDEEDEDEEEEDEEDEDEDGRLLVRGSR
jgi:hypothetical protein